MEVWNPWSYSKVEYVIQTEMLLKGVCKEKAYWKHRVWEKRNIQVYVVHLNTPSQILALPREKHPHLTWKGMGPSKQRSRTHRDFSPSTEILTRQKWYLNLGPAQLGRSVFITLHVSDFRHHFSTWPRGKIYHYQLLNMHYPTKPLKFLQSLWCRDKMKSSYLRQLPCLSSCWADGRGS